MVHRHLHLLALTATLFCMFSAAGCSHSVPAPPPPRPPITAEGEAERRQIMSDPRLTNAQKGAALTQLDMRLAKARTSRNVNYAPPLYEDENFPMYVMFGLSGLSFVVVLIMKLFGGKTAVAVKRPSVSVKVSGAYGAAAAAVPTVEVTAPSRRREPAASAPIQRFVTQEQIDALSDDQRGVSYFTSRPYPLSMLQDVDVMLADGPATVQATEQEADLVSKGRTPLVRALTVNGETRPWFEWPNYDPYTQFWSAERKEWLNLGNGVIASWMPVDHVGLQPHKPKKRWFKQRVLSPLYAYRPRRMALLTAKRQFLLLPEDAQALDRIVDQNSIDELAKINAELLAETGDMERLRAELEELHEDDEGAPVLRDDIDIAQLQIKALEARKQVLEDELAEATPDSSARKLVKGGATVVPRYWDIAGSFKPAQHSMRRRPVSRIKRRLRHDQYSAPMAAQESIMVDAPQFEVPEQEHQEAHGDDAIFDDL